MVIEVRDARAPKATAHPSVGKWTAGRPRVVVLTRADTVTSKTRESWRSAYERLGADRWEETLGGEEKNRNAQWRKERSKYAASNGSSGSIQKADEDESSSDDGYAGGVEEVLFVDAKRGQGTHAITRAVYKAGRHVNERRNRRGLNDRPLRVGIIGFPNVGKVRAFCAIVQFTSLRLTGSTQSTNCTFHTQVCSHQPPIGSEAGQNSKYARRYSIAPMDTCGYRQVFHVGIWRV